MHKTDDFSFGLWVQHEPQSYRMKPVGFDFGVSCDVPRQMAM